MEKQTKHGIVVVLMVGLGLFGQQALAQYADFPPGLHWQQLKTEHFTIVYQEEHADVAETVAQFVEPIHQDVTGLLGYVPASRTYVVLTDHLDAINAFANPIPNNKIVLYLREPGAGTSFFGLHSTDWLPMAFTHEYTHTVQIDMVEKWYGLARKIFGRTVFPNLNFPMWMIEGLAVYMETKYHDGRGHHAHYDMMMRTEILEDQFKPLDRMAAINLRKWPTSTVYYLYGYYFMQYLADTYGEENMIRLSQENARKFPISFSNLFKNVLGKKEKELWKDWKAVLTERYQQQRDTIEADPLTPTYPLSKAGYYSNSPVISPDGQYVYYIDSGPHDSPAIVEYHLSTGKSRRLREGRFQGNIALAPDGQKVYFSELDVYKNFFLPGDLYVMDIASKQVTRLSKGLRACDPAVSPDGTTLVFTKADGAKMSLMRMELDSREISTIWQPAPHTQIAHPVFSSDGMQIALQVWQPGGLQDIYVMQSDGSKLTPVTLDKATDSSPAWGPQNEYIFFSSDRSGVPNIFAYNLNDKTLSQVTNVLTGVFNPHPSPDGKQLAVEYYSSKGMDIHLLDLAPDTWKTTAYSFEELPKTEQPIHRVVAQSQKENSYNPLPSLLPKLWLPVWGFDEEGTQFGVMTYGADVLNQHVYSVSALYGLDSNRVSFGVFYQNKQFIPEITLFGSDIATVFSDIFQDETGNDEYYWQREQVGGLNISFPLYQSHRMDLYFSTGYRYLNIENLTDEDITLHPTPDEGVLSGMSARLLFAAIEDSVYAICPDNGFTASLTYRRDDQALGSDYNLDTFIGDARLYLQIPKLKHHVLALRTVGGLSDGDTLSQGIFQLGGYHGLGELADIEQRHYVLRGYEDNSIAGNRFGLGSAEYRFPIWYPQRGLFGGKFFLDSIVGAAFFDIGEAWNDEAPDIDKFKSSVGAEIRVNVGLQYNASPLTLRFGFAEGLDEDVGESQAYFTFNFNLWL